MEASRYVVIVERTGTGYSAYLPDVEGCVATGASREEVEGRMKAALALHLDGLRAQGCDVPAPQCYSTYVDLPA